jgi:hypothetical protein
LTPRRIRRWERSHRPRSSARVAGDGSRTSKASRCTHERRLIRSMGALSQPLGLRRAETRGLSHEPPGECRSQIGRSRDHPMNRDRLLPFDLERAGLVEAGSAFFVMIPRTVKNSGCRCSASTLPGLRLPMSKSLDDYTGLEEHLRGRAAKAVHSTSLTSMNGARKAARISATRRATCMLARSSYGTPIKTRRLGLSLIAKRNGSGWRARQSREP